MPSSGETQFFRQASQALGNFFHHSAVSKLAIRSGSVSKLALNVLINVLSSKNAAEPMLKIEFS